MSECPSKQNCKLFKTGGCVGKLMVELPFDQLPKCLVPAIDGVQITGTSNGQYFAGGAYRDTNVGKLDYEGFISPIVLERYAQYMNKNRRQSDGKLRESDNWQIGIPQAVYMKSMWRHFMDVWLNHREYDALSREDTEESLCGLLFNVMGMLFEVLNDRYDAEEGEQ